MKKTFALLTAAATLVGTTAIAQQADMAVKARQGQFNTLALNLGILGDIARGNAEYDEATASDAADSIVAISMVHQPILWPEGTSTEDRDDTRALPAIWEDQDDFFSKWEALGEAAEGMQTAAAEGAEAIGPAMRALGGACGDCHDSYRQSDD